VKLFQLDLFLESPAVSPLPPRLELLLYRFPFSINTKGASQKEKRKISSISGRYISSPATVCWIHEWLYGYLFCSEVNLRTSIEDRD
jgi:hypothetical protein